MKRDACVDGSAGPVKPKGRIWLGFTLRVQQDLLYDRSRMFNLSVMNIVCEQKTVLTTCVLLSKANSHNGITAVLSEVIANRTLDMREFAINLN